MRLEIEQDVIDLFMEMNRGCGDPTIRAVRRTINSVIVLIKGCVVSGRVGTMLRTKTIEFIIVCYIR